MMHRSVTAQWWSNILYLLAIVLIVDMGTASFGYGRGLSS
jgi:hypothetical protein